MFASRYSLLTGRYSIRAGINDALMPESTDGLAPTRRPSRTLEVGRLPHGTVGKWHWAIGRVLPTEHGFDSYFGLLYSNDMVRPWVQTDVPLQLYRRTRGIRAR